MKSYLSLLLKRLFPLILFWGLVLLAGFAIPSPLLANGVWDGGGDGISWEDPENWEDDMLPDVIDDICLPVGASVTLDGSRELVRSIYISAEAKLAIGMTASLTVMESLEDGIVIEGTLSNMGSVFINYTGASGIRVKKEGKLVNFGSLVIDDVKDKGLVLMSKAMLENQASGSLDVSRSRSAGISLAEAEAVIKNQGIISIHSTLAEGLGIERGATFKNLTTGELNIGSTGLESIHNHGNFEDRGLLDISGGLGPQQGMQQQPYEAAPLAESSQQSAPNVMSNPPLPQGSNPPPEVPTMGEWALIMLTLGLLSVATLFLGRSRNAFAGTDSLAIAGLVMDRKVYAGVLILTALLAFLGLFLEFLIYGAVAEDNVVGGMLTVPILAYYIHLIYLYERK